MPVAGCFLFRGGSVWNSIRLISRDQQLAAPRKISRIVECIQFLAEVRRFARSPISSRVSQNAAALLFNLFMVDIR
jgi:hypothetical protein